jgi:hypothetical protein
MWLSGNRLLEILQIMIVLQKAFARFTLATEKRDPLPYRIVAVVTYAASWLYGL